MQLRFRQTCRMAQDQAACIGDLIVEEFAEILLIHLAFFRIDDRGKAVQLHILHMQILHGADDIAQLADARRLNQNAVGVVFLQHLLERLAEISDEAAADAAGVHLVDLDACLLEKTAVNTDLTEFVLDQHELFALIAVLDQLLDQRGLARAEEAGKNGDFGHDNALLSMKLLIAADFSAYVYIIAHYQAKCKAKVLFFSMLNLPRTFDQRRRAQHTKAPHAAVEGSCPVSCVRVFRGYWGHPRYIWDKGLFERTAHDFISLDHEVNNRNILAAVGIQPDQALAAPYDPSQAGIKSNGFHNKFPLINSLITLYHNL